MRKRIFHSLCLLALVTALVCTGLISTVIYHESYRRMQTQVRNEAQLIALGINNGEQTFEKASRVSSETRLTLIAPDGSVLFDSAANAAEMENHGSRPEVISAFKNGAGEARRVSGTLGRPTFYYALLLEKGQVLRIAGTSDSVWSLLAVMAPWMALTVLIAVALAMLLARAQTRLIVVPVNNINLDAPLQNDIYDELAPLVTRLARQRAQIEDQMRTLGHKQQEFSAIADHMREGLVVLDAAQHVITVNRSAAALLGVEGRELQGRHILTVNRSDMLRRAVEKAAGGIPCEEQMELQGGVFQLMANPVLENGVMRGVVLLILDVTERRRAEQMRREFSANVSHELKTPLTSILGYAEMLKSGMVRPDDTAAFAGRIYEESHRLIALIEDIIELSRLDEASQEFAFEPLGLLAAATKVAERMQELARQKGVSLTVQGEEISIDAVPKLIDELISNLCDNAIKYNRFGGSVTISVARQGQRAVLSVTDTGIGIPKEHQPRVFERFYRVDKSHSKQTGGTGLGLSIVKHVARLHDATLELESEPQKGTVVRVRFLAAFET